MSTTWTGITLLPGALGAQVLDLLGPWHNCTGLIKSILRCKVSADDFRRAGLRRVTDSLFGGRGDTGPPVLGDPTSWREPKGLDLHLDLHQEGSWNMASIRRALGTWPPSGGLLEHGLLQGGCWNMASIRGALGYSSSILEVVVLKSQGLAMALGYLSSSRTGDLGVTESLHSSRSLVCLIMGRRPRSDDLV